MRDVASGHLTVTLPIGSSTRSDCSNWMHKNKGKEKDKNEGKEETTTLCIGCGTLDRQDLEMGSQRLGR